MFFFNFDQDKLEDYYLAYFDILGYKSYFENENDPYEFLTVIQSAIEDMKKGVNITYSLNNVDIGFRAYSDNFLFYIKHQNNELEAIAALSYLISLIQRRLLEKYSLLIRGGITRGNFYVESDFIFGKGLIDVYNLENHSAKYPRVILNKQKGMFSPITIQVLENSGYITRDSDDYYFIQYLTALGEDDNYSTIRANIKKLVNTNCRYRNTTDLNKISEKEKLITKYLWLVTRYNDFCKKSESKIEEIDFYTTINQRVLKTEVICQ